MIIFSFDDDLPIKNFLNEKGIRLLKIINEEPQLICNNLVGFIEKMPLMMRSSVFRYIKCFLRYDLIEKSDRTRKKNGYVKYSLSDKGKETLKFFLTNFL